MKTPTIERIVVGYDGSEHAEAALEMAATLARQYSASVVVVSAFSHQSRITEPGPEDDREIFDARQLAERGARKLQQDGITAEADALEGPAAEAILNAAEARRADLVVVGSRGMGQFKGLLLGSTSDRVVQHAHVPVLVVR